MDVHNTGRVDKNTFMTFMLDFAPTVAKEELESLFKDLDVNG
jgi:Ca2+-binding EF-hand superfamily protein